jgi:hypothetical protein
VSTCVNVTQFGASTVSVVSVFFHEIFGEHFPHHRSFCCFAPKTSSESVYRKKPKKTIEKFPRDFVRAFLHVEISFCFIVLAIALILLPVTLLKSPNDFWPVVVGGMLSTGIASGFGFFSSLNMKYFLFLNFFQINFI